MSSLTVGVGQQFATVSAAVAASHDGDTIYVQAGTYTNDFSTVNTKISIVGVGGMAHFVASVSIPNGKAIFITNNDVTFDHIECSAATVGSLNGAGIRQQAGNLTVTNSYFHNNQDGILGNAIAGATVTIDHSEFGFNGAGDGRSHNIYIGQIASLTVTNSYFHDASVGHELKSRAATNIIMNNRIDDGNSTASYSIDLPNGGASTIQNNFIQQGPNSQNPTIIAYAEEVTTPPANSSLLVSRNTIFNQRSSALAVWNTTTSVTAMINGNHFYGLTPSQIVSGPNSQSGNDTLPSAPAMDTSHPWLASPWDDLISGGAGADVLHGTSGHDLFVGGGGNDIFVITAGGSSDTIADFVAGPGAGSVANLQGYNFANFAAVQAAMTQNGPDAVLNLGNGETLTFKGVLTSAFAADDFTFGNPPPDTTPPTLSTTNPADNSTNVAVGANLILTFSENVKAGVGNLVIHNAANGSIVATIAITDASQVSFSGSTLTINPTNDLAPGTHYYVTMASGVVQDLAGNAYAGLSAATDFDFTTVPAADTTPPTLSTTLPADNSTNVAVSANLVLTFSENVKAGVGNVVIHNAADGSVVATIAITDATQVSFAGSVLTINPASDLAPGTHYYLTMASGVIQDLAGNAYAGLSAATDFDFTTVPAADTTPPTLSTTLPADNSTNVAVSANLVLTFSENVKAGVGNVVIHNAADGSVVATIAITDATQVSFAGSVLTINPASDLAPGTHYYLTMASGVIQDLAGNAYAGLSLATDYDFTTAPQTVAARAPYDFDGDGHSDFLLQNDNGQVAVWLINGTTVVSSANVGVPDPTWHVEGAGDFDGDGKADILLQNNSGQAAVWLMNGTTLLSNTNVGANLSTSWHVESTGDFNGDGKADILWQNDSSQTQIWLMNGTSVLSTALVGSTPGTSWRIQGAGDFDGDGKSDILLQNDNGQVAVWLMNGTTRTSIGAPGNMGPEWHIKGVGDFNGDGKSDIVLQSDNGQAAVWLMNGTTLVSSTNVGANLGTSWHVQGAEDFNGDGKADILWQNDNGQALVWLMNGTTVLTTSNVGANPGSPWHVLASDDVILTPPADTTPPTLSTINPPDNSTNVAVGANLVLTFSESVKAGSGNLVIHNAADGSAVATIAITDAAQVSFAGSVLTINPTSDLAPGTHYYVTMASGVVQDLAGNAYAGLLAATDFDFTTVAPVDTTPPTLSTTTPADNSTNVAVGANLVLTFSESVKAGSGNLIIHNAADGSAVATIAITDASQVSFAGATLTINPTSDLAPGTHYYVTMASGVVQDLAGNAYAGLSAATDFDFTTAPQTVAVKVASDFDGDGHSDILLQNDSGQAAVWLVNGTNFLTSGNVGAADPTWHAIGAGDFDGDGKADILVQNDSGQAAVWLMNGTNVLSSTNVGANLGTSWHVKGTGDFNGDGKADILWQNDSSQTAVWLMNGTSVLSAANVGSTPGTSWHVEGAGDFNGDGKSDILLQNDNGQAAVWLMNGTTRTSIGAPASMGNEWHIEGAGDFNGDGKSDLLWQNNSGQAAVTLMNGTTALSTSNVGSNPGLSWHVEGAEDFNGDGKADILWQDDSGQAMVWLMNGTTVLTTSNVGANPGSSWHVAPNDDTLASGLTQSASTGAAMDSGPGAPATLVDHSVLFDGHLIF